MAIELGEILLEAVEVLKARGGTIYLRVPEKEELILIAVHGLSIEPGYRLRLGEGLVSKVIQTKQPFIVGDYPSWPSRVRELEHLFTSVIAAPLVLNHEIIGVLSIVDGVEGREFTMNDVAKIEVYAARSVQEIELGELPEPDAPLTLIIDPGTAEPEDVAELLAEISKLYRMLDGSGITFTPTEIKEMEVAL